MNDLQKAQRDQVVERWAEEGSDVSKFMTSVFSWMVVGLLVTAAVSWYFASSGMVSLLIGEGGHTMLGWIVMLSPLGFILAINFGFQRFSSSALTMLFVAFSAVMGASLSYTFLIYTGASLAQVFLISAGTFGAMAFLGYTTSTDLTKMGSLLYMGLIGIILASVVNWFVGSSAMDYLISILGVLIFTGLTAYDTQKLKRIGAGVEYGDEASSEAASKLAILGATSLYLDFINLFLFMLRLMGNRK
jgi:FtsH-binding integral membrane protein